MTYYPEVEGPLRAWLKAHPGLAPLTNNGRFVYFAAPDTTDKPEQWLTLRRIGGAPDPGNTPLDNALITFGCWGRTRQLASGLASALAQALAAIQWESGPVTMDTIVALSARITLMLFQPDPTVSDYPRMVVDASILFRAA